MSSPRCSSIRVLARTTSGSESKPRVDLVPPCFGLSRRTDPVKRKRRNVNKNWLGVIAGLLVIILIVWLLGASKISCHESFWDKNKQVIEIKR